MTTLDRLGIQGIRSYGPEPEQVLGESLQVLGTRCPPSRTAGGAASPGASRSHRRALRPVAAARAVRMPGTHLCVTWPFLCGSLCPCVAARRGAVGAAGSPCFADESASCAGHHLQSAANPDPGTKRQRKDNHHRGTRARCIRLHCKPSRPAACPKPRQKNKRWTMARRKNGCLQSLAVHVTAQASTRLTRFLGGRACSRCGWPRAAFFHRILVCRTCALVSVRPACVGILPPQTGYCTTRVTMSFLAHANACCDAALAIVT